MSDSYKMAGEILERREREEELKKLLESNLIGGPHTRLNVKIEDDGSATVSTIDDTPKVTLSYQKVPFELIDMEFISDMAMNFFNGIKNGRKANDWKRIDWDPDWLDAYKGKILRHLYYLEGALAEEDLPEVARHLASIACSANIIHYHEVQIKNDSTPEEPPSAESI